MGRGLYQVVRQYLQQQYPAEGQASDNNEFINNPFHQLPKTSISIRVFQNIFFSSERIYSKNKITAQCRQNEKISKELAKNDKRTYDSGFSKSMRNLFCFAAKLIYATSFVIKKQHTQWVMKSRTCRGKVHFHFESQRGPIYQGVVSCEKERLG